MLDASVMLSHFPPSGNAYKATHNIAQAVADQQIRGRKLESVVIMAPGEWAKDETIGFWVKQPYATVRPDIEGYKIALGTSDDLPVKTVGYIPEHSMVAAHHPIRGTMLTEFYRDENEIPQVRVLVEGYPPR